MGLVLRSDARLRSCVCTEENTTSDGHNSASHAWGSAGDNDGRV